MTLRRKKLREESQSEYSLPKKKSIPSLKLSDSILLIYGKKKIGKTSLANQFSDKILNLMVEPQARNLEVYQVACDKYEDLIGYTKSLKKSGHGFDAISLDPLPLFYTRAMEYTCRVNGFDHPSGQDDFGQSWNKVRLTFEKAVEPLLRLNVGLFFHAHETTEEIKTREGNKFTIIRPEGGSQVWDFINSNVENIWYYHLRNDKRFLQIRGDSYAFACTAWTDKFYTPDGRQVSAIPMGSSPEEGYQNILKAFDNEQKNTYNEDEEPKKFLKKKKLVRRKK